MNAPYKFDDVLMAVVIIVLAASVVLGGISGIADGCNAARQESHP